MADDLEQGGQQELFPEDDGNGGGDTDMAAGTPGVGDGANQDLPGIIMSLSPEQLAAAIGALDPDVKLSIVQSAMASMTPEQKQMIDTAPSGDVTNAMNNAEPQRPESQYQMSIVRMQKQCASNPGMGALADDHLGKWNQRVDSLGEDGFLSSEEMVDLHKEFDKAGEKKFSILLDNRGLLHDACLKVETLEKARAGMASLSSTLLQGGKTRFSAASPVLRTKADDQDTNFDRKEAEEAGARIARL